MSLRSTTRSRRRPRRFSARRSRTGAPFGDAVVLDPQTGGILAMAVVPHFDANLLPRCAATHRNRAVTDTFEPGSTFKLVTVAAALSEGLSTRTRVHAPYEIQVADRVVHDAEPRGTETMTVAADPVPLLERRRDHARTAPRIASGWETGSIASGSAEPTGIDFPGESPGSCCRSTAGRARRSATFRSARGSP